MIFSGILGESFPSPSLGDGVFLFPKHPGEYLLRFSRCLRYAFGVQSYRTSGGGPGRVYSKNFCSEGVGTTEDPGDFRVEPSRLMKIYKLIEMCVITPQKANGSFTSESP